MMKPIKARKIKNALSKKGFKITEGDHHLYRFYYNEKKYEISTKISHGINEITPKILKKMANQLHLSDDEFNKYIKCAFTYSDLIERYKELKIIL